MPTGDTVVLAEFGYSGLMAGEVCAARPAALRGYPRPRRALRPRPPRRSAATGGCSGKRGGASPNRASSPIGWSRSAVRRRRSPCSRAAWIGTASRRGARARPDARHRAAGGDESAATDPRRLRVAGRFPEARLDLVGDGADARRSGRSSPRRGLPTGCTCTATGARGGGGADGPGGGVRAAFGDRSRWQHRGLPGRDRRGDVQRVAGGRHPPQRHPRARPGPRHRVARRRGRRSRHGRGDGGAARRPGGSARPWAGRGAMRWPTDAAGRGTGGCGRSSGCRSRPGMARRPAPPLRLEATG